MRLGFIGITLLLIAAFAWIGLGAWNNLFTIGFGVSGILLVIVGIYNAFHVEYLHGQSGAVYIRVGHRPEHDVKGTMMWNDEYGVPHVNKYGKTFRLSQPAPDNPRNSWANKPIPPVKVVNAEIKKTKRR